MRIALAQNMRDLLTSKAIQLLMEIGIGHQEYSKHGDQFEDMELDLIIKVFNSVEEDCHLWLRKGEKINLDIPDPAIEKGTEEIILALFLKGH